MGVDSPRRSTIHRLPFHHHPPDTHTLGDSIVVETPISKFEIASTPHHNGRTAAASGHHINLPPGTIPIRRLVPIHSHPLPPDAPPSPFRRSHDEGRRHEVLLPAAEGARRHQANRRRLQEDGGGGGGSPPPEGRARPPRQRRHRSRAPAGGGGGGGAGAGGPVVRHGHAVRTLPRPHPRPTPAPRRRARARPAAGAPRPLHGRPALPLGGTRLGSRWGWTLPSIRRHVRLQQQLVLLCY